MAALSGLRGQVNINKYANMQQTAFDPSDHPILLHTQKSIWAPCTLKNAQEEPNAKGSWPSCSIWRIGSENGLLKQANKNI